MTLCNLCSICSLCLICQHFTKYIHVCYFMVFSRTNKGINQGMANPRSLGKLPLRGRSVGRYVLVNMHEEAGKSLCGWIGRCSGGGRLRLWQCTGVGSDDDRQEEGSLARSAAAWKADEEGRQTGELEAGAAAEHGETQTADITADSGLHCVSERGTSGRH